MQPRLVNLLRLSSLRVHPYQLAGELYCQPVQGQRERTTGYRGVKLNDQGMKVLEHVAQGLI